MITNIRDRRKRPYRFKKINAVIEPTRHDNSVKDADRAPRDREMDQQWLGYDEREHISVDDAVEWAYKHDDDVTLYLYDQDGGIYVRASRKGSGGGNVALGHASRPGRRSQKSARIR